MGEPTDERAVRRLVSATPRPRARRKRRVIVKLATRVRARSKNDRTRAKLGRTRANSIRIRSKSVEPGQTLGESGPHSVEVAPSLAEFARIKSTGMCLGKAHPSQVNKLTHSSCKWHLFDAPLTGTSTADPHIDPPLENPQNRPQGHTRSSSANKHAQIELGRTRSKLAEAGPKWDLAEIEPNSANLAKLGSESGRAWTETKEAHLAQAQDTSSGEQAGRSYYETPRASRIRGMQALPGIIGFRGRGGLGVPLRDPSRRARRGRCSSKSVPGDLNPPWFAATWRPQFA